MGWGGLSRTRPSGGFAKGIPVKEWIPEEMDPLNLA
jgi:hypothetical protein